MATRQRPGKPSRQALLAEVEALRQRVAELEQAQEDLEIMLEMTTDHADAIEADLQSRAEALELRSQFIRETFGRYVSEEVVAQLPDAPEGFELGGELRRVTILMSDLRGFTALAECLQNPRRS